jgi:glutamate racemase
MSPTVDPPLLTPCIGVFDSGVGGLSVLRALHHQMPLATLLYAADSAHAPYGERDDDFIIERSHAMTEHLLSKGAQMIVVACNTATAAAVESLRSAYRELPVVGVEPGLKPAITLTRNRRVGVMATQATLSSAKFQRLVETHAVGISLHLQACQGLAQALESGHVDGEAVGALVSSHAAPLREAGVDTVVLGCTHYPFAAHRIACALGSGVALIDTADAVARQATRLATETRMCSMPTGRKTRLWTTGEPAHLSRVAAHWLDFEIETCTSVRA